MRRRFPRALAALVPIVMLATVAGALRAQTAVAGAGSARAAYLDVLRTRGDMDQAAAELARADALFARSMLAPSERDERSAAYARARLAHLGALLAAEDRAAHVAIERAVKLRTPDGRLHVAITVRTESVELGRGDVDRVSPFDTSALLPPAWSELRGATIALKLEAGANGTTISRPYERALPALSPGRPRTVTLDLLEDVADVVVAIGTGGRVDERRVRLEIASATDAISVDAAQFSLEGELGAQVVYELRLQRPSDGGAATRLAVRGLPAEISYEFRDPDGRTRLGQLRFADGATSARVQLALALPARPSPALRPDAPLAFDVVATDVVATDVVATDVVATDDVPAADGAGRRAARTTGRARLELIPRGVPRVELRPATLALETRGEHPTELALTVRNSGTGRIDDVRLRADLPTHWQATYRPGTIATIAPGDERRVTLVLTPPPGVAVGDYELRVGIDPGAARRIDVEDKLVRVRIAGGDGALGIVLGGTAAVGFIALVLTRGRRWLNR